MSSKRNRTGKRKRHKLLRVSAADLLRQARRSLAGGDGRALDLLRQARHKGARPEELCLLFFLAGTQRAARLAARGLTGEAAHARTQAAGHRASIETSALGEGDLLLYLNALGGADAVEIYADYLAAHPPVAQAQRRLADRLVTERCWKSLEALAPDHPLRRDGERAAPGAAAMMDGDWTRAAELLRGLGRHSPFAPWRLFCKAMLCFGAGDDTGLRRAVDLIPEDFVLAGTVAEWRRLCAGAGPGGSMPVRQALGSASARALTEEFRRALRKDRPRDVETLIPRLAEALYPAEPMLARVDLLKIAALAMLNGSLSDTALLGMTRALLPDDRAAALMPAVALLIQSLSPDRWNPDAAVRYLKFLPMEFPREQDRALARGRVLESVARTAYRGVDPWNIANQARSAVEEITGEQIDEPGMLVVALMMASLRADPGNREGYRFVLDLLHEGHAGYSLLPGILMQMTVQFPGDPDPWLDLASYHYARNAYRQAEKALTEAGARAHHDDRIQQLQAVGFLKSADQSRKAGRFEMAARDLANAQRLRRPELRIVLPAKHILLDIVARGGDAAALAASRLPSLTPFAQLRTLVLLILDLEANVHIKNVNPGAVGALRGLLDVSAGLAARLDAEEVVALLSPVPDDLRLLYDHRRAAAVLRGWWPELMARVEQDRLLDVFDILLEFDARTPVRAEIDRRLRGLSKVERDPVLLFYLATVRYQEGLDPDSRRFADVLRAADPTTKERLREAAARLAAQAAGALNLALREFDFELLDAMPGAGSRAPPALDWPDEEDDPNDRLDFPELPANQPPLFDLLDEDELAGYGEEIVVLALEELIDEADLRGAPRFQLNEFFGDMRLDPKARSILDRLARKLRGTAEETTLSPELRALLYPRRRRGARR